MNDELKNFWVLVDGNVFSRFKTKEEVLEYIIDEIDKDDVGSVNVFEVVNELKIKMTEPELVKIDRDDIYFD